MKLGIYERMELLQLLPPHDTYAGMKEIFTTKLLLNPTPEEAKIINMKQEGNRLVWDPAAAEGLVVDIPFSEFMFNMIRDILRRRSDEGKISDNQLTLYEKFVMDYEQN